MRFPIVLQHDATDCGPAALSMIAAFHGKRIGISRLREMAGTDRHGTTMAGLICAAEQIGLSAKAVRSTPNAVGLCELPLVAHWNEGGRSHFVVVYQVRRNFVRIADPALGKRRLTVKEFREKWTGVLLLLQKTEKLTKTGDRPSTVHRLQSLLRRHLHLFLDVLTAAALTTILGLTSSFFIQVLIDFVFVRGRKPALNWLGLGMLVVLLARSAFQALRSYLVAHLSQRIDADTVMHYYRNLLGLPLTFFTSRGTGEVVSRLNDAVKLRVLVSATLASIATDMFVMLASALTMLIMNWQATAAALVISVIALLLVWKMNRPMKQDQRKALEKAANVETLMVETVQGIHDIKALRAESSFVLRMDARFAEMLEAGFRSQMLMTRSVFVISAGSGLCTVALLWFGGLQVIDGTLTVGQLMALYTLLGIFVVSLERLAVASPALQEGISAVDRWADIADLPGDQPAQWSGSVDRSINGRVEFNEVTFSYCPGVLVLRNLTLRLESGQCVGIFGDSGSGKTTLLHLLTRFSEPSRGAIYIDGIDVLDYTIDCLRREIAFVPSDVTLFNGSLAENVRLGKPAASAEEIRSIVQVTRIDEIAKRLPNGFETKVGFQGATLSRAERQRIALARALLQNPAILILDEFSAKPDAAYNELVQWIIENRRGKRTTIVVSHEQFDFDQVARLNRQVEK